MTVPIGYWRSGFTSVGVILSAALPAILVVTVLAAAIGWRRRPGLRLTLALAVALGSAPLLGYFVADDSPVTGPEVRVTAVNAMFSASPDDIAELGQDSDVVVVNEWPDELVPQVTSALGGDWALAADDRDPYIGGHNTVWVRTSWDFRAEPLPGAFPPASVVTIEREGRQARVVGTRLENPAFRAADLWRRGFDALATEARRGQDPLIVLGDLNAPPSSVAFRDFRRRSGLVDCPAQLGLGFPGTWGPGADPPLAPVPIDHILVADPGSRGAGCLDFATVVVPRTDHRAVRATIALGED